MKKIDIKTPETKLVVACQTNDTLQAELVKNMLLDHGVTATTSGENQTGFPGAFPVRIFVRESDLENAHIFIKTHFPEL